MFDKHVKYDIRVLGIERNEEQQNYLRNAIGLGVVGAILIAAAIKGLSWLYCSIGGSFVLAVIWGLGLAGIFILVPIWLVFVSDFYGRSHTATLAQIKEYCETHPDPFVSTLNQGVEDEDEGV